MIYEFMFQKSKIKLWFEYDTITTTNCIRYAMWCDLFVYNDDAILMAIRIIISVWWFFSDHYFQMSKYFHLNMPKHFISIIFGKRFSFVCFLIKRIHIIIIIIIIDDSGLRFSATNKPCDIFVSNNFFFNEIFFHSSIVCLFHTLESCFFSLNQTKTISNQQIFFSVFVLKTFGGGRSFIFLCFIYKIPGSVL